MVVSARRFASSLRLVLDLNLGYVGYSPADKAVMLELPVSMDQTVTPDLSSFDIVIDGSARGVVGFVWLGDKYCNVSHDGDIMTSDGTVFYKAWDDGFRALDGRLVYAPQIITFHY